MKAIFFQRWRKFTCTAAVLVGLFGCAPVWAQVSLPPVDSRPLGGILDELERDIGGLPADAERRLGSLRQEVIGELARRNRAELQRDPHGELIVRGEITAFSPSPQALAGARAAGFTVLRERSLEGLDARIVVFQVPARQSLRRALRRLQRLDPEGIYDFNHVYLPVGGMRPAGPEEMAAGQPATDLPASTSVRVGLVDGGIASDHPSLREATIQARGCDGTQVPSAHGTAVASLLVGRDEHFRGAAPGGTLLAVDIYCGRATGGAADAFADALAWLAGEGVGVINTSIVGPPNRVLEQAVRAVAARGHLIVAAVGNDGPAARPLFPAAYVGTLGITGVRADQRVLPEAGRGPHVDFAAPGADMLAAGPNAGYAEVRGTSYASPLVAGLLAAAIGQPDPEAVQVAIAALAAVAIDLGRKGRDEVYGEGLVAESLRVTP